ncbi:MAG: GTPase HflX [Patescibacteria group bacterium]|jgi:GTP-binding protein HflX
MTPEKKSGGAGSGFAGKAILIDLIHPRMRAAQSEERLRELEELVNTFGGLVIVKKYQRRFAPHPRTFIGPGKAAELSDEGRTLGAKFLIVNDRLKPRQMYELQEILKPAGVEVWDRLDLILKIFAKHAQTTEARLEIELAGIRHMGPRIFRMGLELSRQGGGIGTSGIGETNIERMKRHLKERERTIVEKIKQYENVRAGHRQDRRRRGLKTISVVGYTNAGKTSLLNTLTGRHEYVANKLFATLDTRVGQLYLPERHEQALVSDTIGFIKNLPPELLHAFKSTLSEAVESDLLLHVIDVSDPMMRFKIAVVEKVLCELGVEKTPKLYVFNKIDLCSKTDFSTIAKRWKTYNPVFVSAEKGLGMKTLIQAIEEEF